MPFAPDWSPTAASPSWPTPSCACSRPRSKTATPRAPVPETRASRAIRGRRLKGLPCPFAPSLTRLARPRRVRSQNQTQRLLNATRSPTPAAAHCLPARHQQTGWAVSHRFRQRPEAPSKSMNTAQNSARAALAICLLEIALLLPSAVFAQTSSSQHVPTTASQPLPQSGALDPDCTPIDGGNPDGVPPVR